MAVRARVDVPRPRVSVVVPALNEARNLPHVIARIPSNVHEVILVDGCSVDGTVTVARQLRPDVRVVTQTRKGNGNALACGFAVTGVYRGFMQLRWLARGMNVRTAGPAAGYRLGGARRCRLSVLTQPYRHVAPDRSRAPES